MAQGCATNIQSLKRLNIEEKRRINISSFFVSEKRQGRIFQSLLKGPLPMARFLILYGTTEGHTVKIVDRIAQVVGAKGHKVETRRGDALPNDLTPALFDAVIVGASVHMGKHTSYINNFVKANLVLLKHTPSAFFSVSLTARDTSKERREQAEQYVEKFFSKTNWRPDRVGIFAGALLYTQYGFLKRFIMKMITKPAGGDTDTSRDYEYTDWKAVTRFAEECVTLLR